MKISKVETHIVSLPIEEPFTNIGVNPNARRAFVVVQLWTDDGIEGIGVTSFGAGLTTTLRSAVDQLGEALIGYDPFRTEAAFKRMYEFAGPSGPEGIFLLAVSALDIAMWDIKGKAMGQPIWKLLGGARERIPTYASGAMMRSLSDDQAAAAAHRLVELGFREMKMHLAMPGDANVKRERERARIIRDAIGPDVKLMGDINQRWRVDQAIAIGQQLEEFHYTWFEDVTAWQDYPGLARVAAALSTPIAGGELAWGVTPFRHMIEMNSVDIVMIDILRVGGITQWLKVAAMAEAFNLPVVSHLLPEIQVHLIGAVPNGLTLEYMPWSYRLFKSVPWPEKGEIAMPTGPGLGLELDHETIKRYGAAS